MTIRVGIAGAGLSGRLTALNCLARGWQVSLFDADSHLGHNSCGWVGAGMLAPYTELEASEVLICKLGLAALRQWPLLLKQLTEPVTFAQNGTLILNHPQDKGERERLMALIDFKLRSAQLSPLAELAEYIPNVALQEFVPGLARDLQDAYWLKNEGHINSHEFYKASTATLLAHDVNWHELSPVQVDAHQINTQEKSHQFDVVFDCRGLGAKVDWPQLRGIRGEVLILHAPEVRLNCPIRIMHPRYPIYLSPRTGNTFVVGATSIESEDQSPISAQSMLELLSACYMVHPGFAEARILHTMTQCRPTLADNHPQIIASEGLIRINGLYRHGYLIGPAVVDEAMRYLEHGKQAMHHPELVDE